VVGRCDRVTVHEANGEYDNEENYRISLVSVDGAFAGPGLSESMGYRDDAHIRDGLGQLLACDAMLMGRTTYEHFAKTCPGNIHPWANRLNAIQKYVFSTKLERADWNNSTIIRGGVAAEVTKLKRQEGGNPLVYGHGLLEQTLLKERLLGVLDISIHPVLVGSGKLLFREGEYAKFKLVATRSFSNIVKVTYEPQY
jgi:dihydrofolate reductase